MNDPRIVVTDAPVAAEVVAQEREGSAFNLGIWITIAFVALLAVVLLFTHPWESGTTSTTTTVNNPAPAQAPPAQAPSNTTIVNPPANNTTINNPPPAAAPAANTNAGTAPEPKSSP